MVDMAVTTLLSRLMIWLVVLDPILTLLRPVVCMGLRWINLIAVVVRSKPPKGIDSQGAVRMIRQYMRLIEPLVLWCLDNSARLARIASYKNDWLPRIERWERRKRRVSYLPKT